MPRVINLQISVKGIILLLVTAAVVWMALNFSSIMFLLFIAILLAVAITPLVNRLEKRRVPRIVAIVLVYVVLVGVVGGALALLAPLLITETTLLGKALPTITQSALNIKGTWLGRRFPSISQLIPNQESLIPTLSDQLGAIVGSAGGLLLSLGSVLSTILLGGLLVLVVSFILTSDARFAPRFIARFFPPHYRKTASDIASEIGERLGHWVRAQLIVCLFYGTALGLGFRLMSVPYAFSLGVAAVIFELVPYVGGLTVTVIAMLVALSVSPWLALGVLGWYFVVANIESNIVYPKVVGESVGVHPLVIIVALFVGAEAQGIMGALLAVPTTVILQVLFDRFYRFEEQAEAEEEIAASVTAAAVSIQPVAVTPPVKSTAQ